MSKNYKSYQTYSKVNEIIYYCVNMMHGFLDFPLSEVLVWDGTKFQMFCPKLLTLILYVCGYVWDTPT